MNRNWSLCSKKISSVLHHWFSFDALGSSYYSCVSDAFLHITLTFALSITSRAVYNLMIFAFSPLTHGVIKVRTKVIKYWRQDFMDKTSNMRPSVL